MNIIDLEGTEERYRDVSIEEWKELEMNDALF